MRILFLIGGFLVYCSVCCGACREATLFVIGTHGQARLVAVEQPPTRGFRPSDLRVRYEFIGADGLNHHGEAVIAPNSGAAEVIKLAAATRLSVGVRYLAAYPTVSRLVIDNSLTASLALLLGFFLLAIAMVTRVRLWRELRQFDCWVASLFGEKSPDARYMETTAGGRTVFELYGRLIMIRGPEEAIVLDLDKLDSTAKRESRYPITLFVGAFLTGFPLFLDTVFLLCDPAILAEAGMVGVNLLMLPGIYLVLQHRRRTEWAVFSAPGGEPFFAVPRCGPDSSRWEEFVSAVERAILAPPDPAAGVP